MFTQKFTHFDEVTLDASTIGLQMPERADVKIRGVIVGEVLGFSATDAGRDGDARHLPRASCTRSRAT